MILKQKIAAIIAFSAFIFAAGMIETIPVISFALLSVMFGAIVIGGLNEIKKVPATRTGRSGDK